MSESYTARSDAEVIQSGAGYLETPLEPSTRAIREFDEVMSCPSRSGAMEEDRYFFEKFYGLVKND